MDVKGTETSGQVPTEDTKLGRRSLAPEVERLARTTGRLECTGHGRAREMYLNLRAESGMVTGHLGLTIQERKRGKPTAFSWARVVERTVSEAVAATEALIRHWSGHLAERRAVYAAKMLRDAEQIAALIDPRYGLDGAPEELTAAESAAGWSGVWVALVRERESPYAFTPLRLRVREGVTWGTETYGWRAEWTPVGEGTTEGRDTPHGAADVAVLDLLRDLLAGHPEWTLISLRPPLWEERTTSYGLRDRYAPMPGTVAPAPEGS